MHVVATAGHVDHGKSALVRALTDMDPDRWAEEKRRGLTIDLGFVWTTLPSGADVAFVDVPGHEKFLGNMLAGVGPAPVVIFVVAADEGWQAQSTDHRDALRALDIQYGLIAVTRADRAGAARRAEVTAQVRHELAGTALADAPLVEVSAHTGEGIAQMRQVLDQVLARVPAPDPQARVRVWIDRAFSVKGVGTVVTGTLAAGTLRVGDKLQLASPEGTREVEVRGLHSENTAHQVLEPTSRVAVNLRGISADAIHRGHSLLSPGAWELVEQIDVRRTFGQDFYELPQNIVVHIGTAGLEAHVRPLSADYARLSLAYPLPLQLLDRFVVRSPGGRHVSAGVQVIDVYPPELNRRGAARRRAEELELLADGNSAGRDRNDRSPSDATTTAAASTPAASPSPFTDPTGYIQRVGYVPVDKLQRAGFAVGDPAAPPQGIIAFRQWWIAAREITRWKNQLLVALEKHAQDNPLAAGMPRKAAMDALELQEDPLLGIAVAAAKVEQADGVVRLPGHKVDLGEAEASVAKLEAWLADDPFAAPEADELQELRLGAKQLAAAENAGRLLRLGQGIIVLPSAPQQAKQRIAQLEQPFTLSAARKALGTTRRVAIPLLEYLDEQGITRRLDGGLRELR
ncbi:selenocysteine-specific translation elongation factor [Corynebacterium propinquum]|uniref:selenocysteine-specific translation elongation factor n=1 Tax=Corynebacterium propinquum TaxID=43769 RepID=UPI000665852C|nr:selenocysteine-specific translation elongation factor [Corynebacterium propinquum]MCT1818021.1 selenocysteine-specific translation elongation factor [Corynebacterium propinquum]MDK4235613.1 selenocysteine-specific translation elongation factor [Corynebacterium propinquum]MDK4258887.1 selenocysteine-specific translation elongation factor [Corynebacterium propinquum]MDK4292724.1 selenocysteine-specific translation elongation factor [Corynebacterium propinquum]MDK4299571.1 selenocysteine-speci